MRAVANPSRRERNKLANRRRILEGAMDVFARVGYQAATVTDVVKASGLSVGTFYNYYGDKDAIFAELVNDLLENTRQALFDARQSATTIEEFIVGAFSAYGSLISDNSGMRHLIARNTHAFRQFVFGGGRIAGIVADLENDLRRAIDEGLLPPFNVRLMTSAMIGAGMEVFTFDDEDAEMSPQKRAEFLGHLFLGGVARLASQD